MANYQKFFDEAKKQNIEALEISVTKNKNFSFSLFRSEIDSYQISDSFALEARGIYHGKIGYARSEKMDATTVDYILSHIKENATLTTSEDTPFIFKGSEKYHKKNIYSKALENTPAEEKIVMLKELDGKIRAKSNKINEVEAFYEETTSDFSMLNSYGLKLTSKSNYSVVYASALANDESGETKNGMSFKILEDLSKWNIEEMADKVVSETLSQFGSKPCKSGKYKCVLGPSAVSSLLSAYLANLSSEQVQKNASLLANKKNEKVASSKLTVTENPLQKNVFFRYFDDEGVATYNKALIKNGVLQTYLYNLKTANKDSVASTGNGYKGRGGQVGISLVNVAIKPGKLSEEELVEKAGNGIYIDELSGLHAGLNAQSGNFSLLSKGFLIEDGKKTKPVALITSAGNLFDIFKNVTAVGNNVEMRPNSYQVPSLLIKEISISGE